MSFEDFVLKKIDRDRSDHKRAMKLEPRRQAAEEIQKAYSRALTVLKNPEHRVQATEFFDLYGKENVTADMMRVKAMQTELVKNDTPQHIESKQAAEVFEAILLEQGEMSEWLGRNVHLLKTSLYDDYFNHSDMMAEWTDPNEESRVLSLSVDVTFGIKSAEKKLIAIRRRIDQGKMGTIKYFKSADGSMRGERRMIPEIVLGVSRECVRNLSSLWLKGDKVSLSKHPIQRALIDEMSTQLRLGEGYAAGRGQMDVAASYARSRSTIDKLASEKSAVSIGEIERDPVYREILGQTRTIFQA